MVLCVVHNALARLMRRAAGRHRANRPGGRAAELRIFLDQHDIAAERTCLDRGGKPASAATNDNDVVGGSFHHGSCLARSPAVAPAILPNTEPFIRPVPPG